MKYKIISSILFLVLGFSQLAMAQSPEGKGKMDKESRAKIKALHKAYITDKLTLSDKETEAFWPIYEAHQKKVQELRRSFKKLKKSIKDMSDAEADQFVDKMLVLEQKKLDLKILLYKELKPIISSKKIMRLERAEKGFKMEVMKRMKRHRERR